MRQIVQQYKTGELWIEEVPTPICRKGGVLVRNQFSLVSTGTERMKITQARMNLLEKAKARPDQVIKVLQSVRQVGLMTTLDKVNERLDALMPLGYSSAGIVVEVGEGIDGIAIGDRVACAGEGIACHAEFAFVPKNLCAVVPENVDSRYAAFSTVGAIAMNGVRQAKVGLGDTVLVIGLGLVGLLAVQLLRAAGCRPIGVDIDHEKVDLAMENGAEAAFHRDDPNLLESLKQLSGSRGVDAVYVAASTKSSDPMDLAGEVARDRANVVVVGMVPIQADWRVYYAKELTILTSRSYGPGRYDSTYETKGIDYPIGYVPWTLRRNLDEFLRLVSDGSINPSLLKTPQFPFDEAQEAYSKLHSQPEKYSNGILFEYSAASTCNRRVPDSHAAKVRKRSDIVSIGMIGAGNFATGTLIPALKKIRNVDLHAICSAGGLSARAASKRHGFKYATSEIDQILDDPAINAVVIATRHDTHAEFAARCLTAGKHVFVEKPLALNHRELASLFQRSSQSDLILMPGFNRRFSPLSKSVRDFFPTSAGPLEIVCRVNAGPIQENSWYQDPDEGGWRIVSEGCHFIDLIVYIANSLPRSISAKMINTHVDRRQNDNCVLTIELANGSIGVLVYVANGDPGFEKERIEVFGQNKVAVIDNWRYAALSTKGKSQRVKPRGSGKGHLAELQAFVDAVITGGDSPIAADAAFSVSETMLLAADSLLDSGTTRYIGQDSTSDHSH